MSTLDPAGPAAALIARLWWVLLTICVIVFMVVCALLLRAATRHRQQAPAEFPSPRFPTAAAERRTVGWTLLAGAGIPAVILVGIFAVSMRTMGALESGEAASLTILVTGHQFWWDVVYLDDDGMPLVRTANEIRIPAGRPVELRLASADVIHSFWVPRLAGKLDMIPGITNVLRIVAAEPGLYRGQCAEYCGVQHTRMALLLEALPDTAFESWLAWNRTAAVEPEPGSRAEAGRAVFLRSACVACHTIRGVRAEADLGPDLTHFADRHTLGAAMLPNNRGNLGGWIAGPQSVKPGIRMPAVPLPPDSLNALLDYLASLR